MKNNGSFFYDKQSEPVSCNVAFANRQVFIYFQDPEKLLMWVPDKIKVATFDGSELTLVADTEPSHELVCTGEVAPEIYAAWLERDVPRKKERSFTWKHLTLIAVAGLLITGLAFYLINSVLPSIAARSAGWVPVDLEISLGEKLSEAYILQAESKEKNDSLNYYLGQFVSQLKLNTTYPIRVRLIDSEEINAFALPGGNIFIYSGLLKRMSSHEELVALLGHEISHVTHRHSLKSIISSAAGGMLISAFFGDMGGVSTWIVSKAGEFKQLEYSRDLEMEADQAGLELMTQNKVDPQGMIRLLKLLQKENGNAPELMKYLSTHPDTESRIRSVEGNQLSKNSSVKNLMLQGYFDRISTLAK
jgi:predicted Zn-dependent protease